MQSKGLSRVFSNITVQKHQFFCAQLSFLCVCSAFFIVQLSHPYMTTGKTIALTRWNFPNYTFLNKDPTLHLVTVSLKEMRIPDHLTCLLRNLYAGQEATVRTGHGTTDLFQIGKGVFQGCILSPCLFNLYAEYT